MVKKSISASTDNSAKDKALKLVKIVLEKQAHDPVVLDIRGMSSLCDYFVICSGETGRQVQAIGENIKHRAKEEGLVVHHSESDDVYDWLLVDLFDVVVHIFTDEARKYYNLEYLWREAKAVKPAAKPKAKTKKPATKSKPKSSRRK